MKRRLVKIMCEKKELRFSIFMLYSLADKWKMSPAKVYKILNSTGILDNYIIKCYDVPALLFFRFHHHESDTAGKAFLPFPDLTIYRQEAWLLLQNNIFLRM